MKHLDFHKETTADETVLIHLTTLCRTAVQRMQKEYQGRSGLHISTTAGCETPLGDPVAMPPPAEKNLISGITELPF